MVENEETITLSGVYRQLNRFLLVLDQAGRHSAAAHLVAAIELLENDTGPSAGPAAEREPDSVVTTIARGMTRCFGARAEAVARTQLVGATGSAMLAWAAIVNRIAE
jgi:hypothetical protein